VFPFSVRGFELPLGKAKEVGTAVPSRPKTKRLAQETGTYLSP